MAKALPSAATGELSAGSGSRMSRNLPQKHMFWKNVRLRQSAPTSRTCSSVWDGTIEPGKVFDLTLPLDHVAEAYAAMDQRRATKVVLGPRPDCSAAGSFVPSRDG